MQVSNNVLSKINIIKELGYGLSQKSTIMDFGCGSGGTVQELRNLGYQSFGCDFEFRQQNNVDTTGMKDRKIIRLIRQRPYRLPFDDDTFDVVLSDQVFEHVQNYSESIAEINRVLKTDGICLHILPSRYKPIEVHTFVPFSSVIKSYPWLYLWAAMGIRNKHQVGLSVRETADRNYNYLSNHTNYLTKRQIYKHFGMYFKEVEFCERLFLKFSKRGQFFYRLSGILMFIPSIYSALHSRVVVARLTKIASA